MAAFRRYGHVAILALTKFKLELYVTDRDICRLTLPTPSVTQPTMSFQLPAGMRPAQAPQKGMSEEERAQQQQQQQQREEMKRQMIQAMLEPEARERRECSSASL